MLSLWRRMLDALSSVWFGVSALTAIFIYLAIGSALIFVRQYFEMTEMEFFSAPVFVGLLAIFCLSIITVTLRRIPLTIHKVGVWTVHTGLVVLAVGCFIYFSRKTEGELLVFRRLVMAQAGDGPTVSMIPLPRAAEARATLDAADGPYELDVWAVDPARQLTDDPDGPKDWAAMVRIRRGGQQWIRVLHAASPQFDDLLPTVPGQSAPATQPADLRLWLATDAQDRFYEAHTSALYVSRPGRPGGAMLPIRGLPRYHEHTGDLPVDFAGKEVANRGAVRIPLDTRPVEGLAGLELTVCGFLPYALPFGWLDDPRGPQRPVAFVQVKVRSDEEFLALDAAEPAGEISPRLGIESRLVLSEDPQHVVDGLRTVEPRLIVRIPGESFQQAWPLRDLGELRPAGQTGYSIKLRGVFSSPTSADRATSVALVEIRNRDRQFTRAVTAGRDGKSLDFEAGAQRPPLDGKLLDDAIELEFLDPAAPVVCVVSDPGLREFRLVARSSLGTVENRPFSLLETAELPLFGFEPDTAVRCYQIFRHAMPAAWARIVPRSFRQRLGEVGDSRNMICLAIRKPDWDQPQLVWLARQERIHLAQPTYVDVPGVGRIGLVFGPRSVPLGGTVELLDFEHRTDPSGQVTRDFISRLRLTEADTGRVTDAEVSLNHPVKQGSWHMFQSQWDKDLQAHTGLLVTNRAGMGVMAAGIAMMIIGMIYAFYVKPKLRIRSQSVSHATWTVHRFWACATAVSAVFGHPARLAEPWHTPDGTGSPMAARRALEEALA